VFSGSGTGSGTVPSGISAGVDAGGSSLGRGAQAAARNRVSIGSYSVSLTKRPSYQCSAKLLTLSGCVQLLFVKTISSNFQKIRLT
jgi:hypothetical protein